MEPKAKKFIFTSYKVEPAQKKFIFEYAIEFADQSKMEFAETITFPQKFNVAKVPAEILKNALEGVHLILGISYYKLYCPRKIETPKIILSKEQAEFWNTVYRKGLGEFFYRNQLNSKNLIKFPFAKKSEMPKEITEFPRKERALLGIGGGKDSIVAAEILKENKINFDSLLIETQKESSIASAVVEEIGAGKLVIKRQLDEKIFQTHEGSFNGHVPISAVFAFLGHLTAILYDYSSVIVGNEYSSNFGNLEYGGEIINHQWSKSAEFESLFQEYSREFISPSITYFSLLRPFHEIRIVEMFAKYKKYFPLFTSCNRSFRVHKDRPEELWCGECPKCVFVFLMLSAFLSKKELLRTFGKNLYDDSALTPLFADVLGLGKIKPFDCVGTFQEARVALHLAEHKFEDSLIVKKFFPKIKISAKDINDVLRTNDAPTLPERFKLMVARNVLILGYGKEGKITKEYLKKYFPKLKVGIADKKQGADYLEAQKDFDLAVKTPGLPRNLVTIPHTTATNLFFSQIKNLTIGVTGSKGKSTTASLIHAILKAAGKKVTLLGNIGSPMLEVLMRPISKDEIFVLELSSYQLDDIQYSPQIAILLNLFPEHMNYHGSVEKYYEAKKNIARFQRAIDHFVYNQKNKLVEKYSREVGAKKIPFGGKISLGDLKMPLRGEHNMENIKAAIAVAHLLNVSEKNIKKAIENFKPLSHRLELVGEFGGVEFFDDAISTTPESTMAALEALPNVKTIFLGGEDRGYDFSQLEKVIRAKKVENIVLFPDSGKRVLKSEKRLNILKTSSMKEAVAFACKHTPKGAKCLLSTASPSYSLWKNFEEKGDQFQYWVKKLGKMKK